MTGPPMPDDLTPDAGLVRADEGDEDPFDKTRTGKIPIEEKLARQVDRIAYLRSASLPWGEAVFHLRDMVVGLEDDEFYDGIPNQEREKIKNGDHELTMEEARERYAEFGWDGFTMRTWEQADGTLVTDPSPADLSKAYRIIQRLLARKGLVYKRKTRTRFAPYGEDPHDAGPGPNGGDA